MPLMLRMTDSLEKFVALDLPFLHNERQARIDNLKQALGDPQVNAGEKFRRILEAYQIEVDYGRTLGVERIDIDGRSMDVLRVGRIANPDNISFMAGQKTLLIGEDSGDEHQRSEEHTSEIQSQMRHSYDVFCLKKN